MHHRGSLVKVRKSKIREIEKQPMNLILILLCLDTEAEFNALYQKALENTKQLAASVTQIGAMDQVAKRGSREEREKRERDRPRPKDGDRNERKRQRDKETEI